LPQSKATLEAIGTAYRTAYLAHNPSLAPLAAKVRFTENHVEMPLPGRRRPRCVPAA